jgi:hypothetical protein
MTQVRSLLSNREHVIALHHRHHKNCRVARKGNKQTIDDDVKTDIMHSIRKLHH